MSRRAGRPTLVASEKRAKRNPARDPLVVMDQFVELLLDAYDDPASLMVATDLVQESGIDLAWLSSESIGTFEEPQPMRGAFVLAFEGEWGVGEDPRIKWGVRWAVVPHKTEGYYKHNGWKLDGMWILNDHAYPWVDPTWFGLPSYRQDIQVAVDDAVRVAWDGLGVITNKLVSLSGNLDSLRGLLKYVKPSRVPSSLATGLDPKKKAKSTPKQNPVGEEWQEHEMIVRSVVEENPILSIYGAEVHSAQSPEGREYVARREGWDGETRLMPGDFVLHGQDRMILIMITRPPLPYDDRMMGYIDDAITSVLARLNREWPLDGAKWQQSDFGWNSEWRGTNMDVASYVIEILPALRRNPARTKDEVMAEFRKLCLDPDPGAMGIAEDLLLEHGITLTEASHATLLAEGWPSDTTPTPAVPWADGLFVLGHQPSLFTRPSTEIRDVVGPAVQWWITRSEDRRPRFQHEQVTQYNPSVQLIVPGQDGPSWVPRGVYPTSYRNDERLAIDDAVRFAWAAAKGLKAAFATSPKNHDFIQTAVVAYVKDGAATIPMELVRSAPAAPKQNPHQGPRNAPITEWSPATDKVDQNDMRRSWYYKVGYNIASFSMHGRLTMEPGPNDVAAIDALLEVDPRNSTDPRIQQGLNMVHTDDGTSMWERFLTQRTAAERPGGAIGEPEHAKWWRRSPSDAAVQASIATHHNNVRLWTMGFVQKVLDVLERRNGLRENPGGTGAILRTRATPAPLEDEDPNMPDGPMITVTDHRHGTPNIIGWYAGPQGGDPVPWASNFIWNEGAIDLVTPSNPVEYGFWGASGNPMLTFTLVNFTSDQLIAVRDRIAELAAEDPDWTGLQENPARTFKCNPPSWVTRFLSDAWVALEEQVPAKWMPKISRTQAKGRKMVADIAEYGCGVYGCVMPTLDPKVVLKITTDDTEAHFAHELAEKMPPHVVTKYELVLALPDEHEGRNVYLLWREAADHVGDVDKVLGKKFDALVDQQHGAAQVALKQAWAIDQGKSDDYVELTEALGVWLATLYEMARAPAFKDLADGMRDAFIDNHVFMGDVHAGNMGLANSKWVITDPGNVVVIDKDTVRDAVLLFSDWRNEQRR